MLSIGPAADARPDGQGLEGLSDGDAATSLSTLKEWFRESEEALYSSRRASQRDRDYVDGKQWTSAESRALKQRGQSDAVYNRMRAKVDTIVGVEQQMRSDPRAYPRSPNGEEDATTATDALRYVCDRTRFDQTASMVFDQACCVEGVSGAEIIMEAREGGEPEIAINFFPFDRLGWDPHARRPDFEDARYKHTITWMDGEQAKKQWPDKAEFIGQTIAAAPTTQSEVYDDAPRFWADRTRNRVQIVQMWWLEGTEWFVAVFVGGGFLDDPMPSPYVTDDGESACGLEICSGYVSREGERYGAARQWIGPQDDINKRRSKAQHLLSVRQTVADQGVVKDKRAFKREMARPDGHWDKDTDGDLTILPTGEMAQGQMALLQEAKQEIDATGPNSASMVAGDAGVGPESGIALQSAQRAGMLELSLLLDHHREWKLRVYRQIWSRVRQFWRAPRWLRVTDDPDSLRWVGMNQPVTAGEQAGQALAQQLPPDMPPEQRQMAEQQIQGQLQADPRSQIVMEIANQPSQMDVDIVIDEGPDVVTTAAQEFELLVRLSERYPNIPVQAILKASPLRGKDELLQALEGDPQQAAAMQQAQQKQEQLTEAAIMSQVRKALADAAHKEAQAQQIAAETPSEIEYNEARADQATATAAKTAREAGQVVAFQ